MPNFGVDVRLAALQGCCNHCYPSRSLLATAWLECLASLKLFIGWARFLISFAFCRDRETEQPRSAPQDQPMPEAQQDSTAAREWPLTAAFTVPTCDCLPQSCSLMLTGSVFLQWTQGPDWQQLGVKLQRLQRSRQGKGPRSKRPW